MRLQGCGTALITPFTANGDVDEAALRSLVKWQVESGIHFLVPCGTTGETPALTHDEILRVLEITIETAAGRVPIVAGASSNATREAAVKAAEVSRVPGVDFILTASPYYNKPSQEGQFQHFSAIAEASAKPLIIYNVPGRTGVNLETSTLARLAQLPNIAGVKEASGSMTQIANTIKAVPDAFSVLSGDDALTLPTMVLGGTGIISVASNEIPAEMSEMAQAALDGDWGRARELHHKYLPLMTANFFESNPMPVKAVMAMMGRIQEIYRLPMVPVKAETRAKLAAIVDEFELRGDE